jgi:hypothetical protein
VLNKHAVQNTTCVIRAVGGAEARGGARSSRPQRRGAKARDSNFKFVRGAKAQNRKLVSNLYFSDDSYP